MSEVKKETHFRLPVCVKELNECKATYATLQREADSINKMLSERITTLQREAESLRTQRDQALHLLRGFNLTKEQVLESGLGEGVLIENRCAERRLVKYQDEVESLRAALQKAKVALESCRDNGSTDQSTIRGALAAIKECL